MEFNYYAIPIAFLCVWIMTALMIAVTYWKNVNATPHLVVSFGKWCYTLFWFTSMISVFIFVVKNL